VSNAFSCFSWRKFFLLNRVLETAGIRAAVPFWVLEKFLPASARMEFPDRMLFGSGTKVRDTPVPVSARKAFMAVK
jgi:hypothetical protein